VVSSSSGPLAITASVIAVISANPSTAVFFNVSSL
jgi:hypothetical protein